MHLTLEAKKRIVEQVASVAKQSSCVIAAEYRGLSVTNMTILRRSARESQVHIQVIRNTLARRAFADTPFACIHDGLVGPLLLAFSGEEPGAAARLLRDFIRHNEVLLVKHIAMNGKLLEASELVMLAELPSLDEGRARLLNVLSASMSRFVRTIAEPQAKWVRLLAQYRDSQSK